MQLDAGQTMIFRKELVGKVKTAWAKVRNLYAHLERYSVAVQRAHGSSAWAVCRDFDAIGIRLYAIGHFRVSLTWPAAPRVQRRVIYQYEPEPTAPAVTTLAA
jgi:hypothetical protein